MSENHQWYCYCEDRHEWRQEIASALDKCPECGESITMCSAEEMREADWIMWLREQHTGADIVKG